MISKETIQTAKKVQKMYGSNYYTATLLLPKDVRYAVFIFYAFVRTADEIVDNPESSESAALQLQAFTENWRRVYTGESENGGEIFTAFREICQTYDIDFSLTEDFLKAMQQDLTVQRYETYDDLKEYMYGSAEVIGIILTKLFRCTEPSALQHARALGEAMQLTNFIRDIHDDYHTRDRIYLPKKDMVDYSVTENDLIEVPSSEAVRKLIAFEVRRAHSLFSFANAGIHYLPKNVQPAVRTASALYENILKEITKNDYAVSIEKISFSTLTKLKIALLYGYGKRN